MPFTLDPNLTAAYERHQRLLDAAAIHRRARDAQEAAWGASRRRRRRPATSGLRRLRPRWLALP